MSGGHRPGLLERATDSVASKAAARLMMTIGLPVIGYALSQSIDLGIQYLRMMSAKMEAMGERMAVLETRAAAGAADADQVKRDLKAIDFTVQSVDGRLYRLEAEVRAVR